MTVSVQSFARDFAAARERFLAAATRAGAMLESYPHPLPGPGGEPLTCDIARLSSDKARRLLVLVTGVHGVEHYAGSACAIDWLEGGGGDRLPEDAAAVVIHAINPWGAAHFRRYTEDNVDLARNFVDFGGPLPPHDAYEKIHSAISDPDRDRVEASLANLFAELGERNSIEALMAGQYRHADGFSFGGSAPCWSHKLVLDLLKRHAASAESVAIVELHSGLGPYSHGMIVTMQDETSLARLRSCFGDELHLPRVNEGLHSSPGHTTDGYLGALPGKTVDSIVLEFGTYPPDRSLPVLLADHWLTQHGDPGSEAGLAIKADNLEMHCPDDPQWEASVLARSREVIAKMLDLLGEPA